MTISLTDNGVVLYGSPDSARSFIMGDLSGNPGATGTTRQHLSPFSSEDVALHNPRTWGKGMASYGN